MIMNDNTDTTLSSPFNSHDSDQVDATVEPTKENAICPVTRTASGNKKFCVYTWVNYGAKQLSWCT